MGRPCCPRMIWGEKASGLFMQVFIGVLPVVVRIPARNCFLEVVYVNTLGSVLLCMKIVLSFLVVSALWANSVVMLVWSRMRCCLISRFYLRSGDVENNKSRMLFPRVGSLPVRVMVSRQIWFITLRDMLTIFSSQLIIRRLKSLAMIRLRNLAPALVRRVIFSKRDWRLLGFEFVWR